MTVGKLWPVANIQLNVKLQTSRAGHEDWVDSHTFIVETAVIGMGSKHCISILTFRANNIKTRPVFYDQRFAAGEDKKRAEEE